MRVARHRRRRSGNFEDIMDVTLGALVGGVGSAEFFYGSVSC
jgi:hypothetical protein